jgi:hypothetical protein
MASSSASTAKIKEVSGSPRTVGSPRNYVSTGLLIKDICEEHTFSLGERVEGMASYVILVVDLKLVTIAKFK